jgi:hypothetical protein
MTNIAKSCDVSNFPNDQEFLQFTEEWWRSFMVYEGEEGRAYASHVFNHVSKQHLIDFLRDGVVEFKINNTRENIEQNKE